jgi:hypothetical protein
MVARGVHFVGGYPGGSAEGAMRAMIDEAGRRIDLVPSVEPMPMNCSVGAAEEPSSGLGSNSAREAQLISDPRTPWGPTDYVKHAVSARAVLDRLEREYDRQFTLQQGLPHYIDMALARLGPYVTDIAIDLPLARALAEQLRHQIQAIITTIGADTVLFQIDSRHALDAPVRNSLGWRGATAEVPVGETVAMVINRATPQVRFGVHLCSEDMSDEAKRRLSMPAAIARGGEAIGEALERPEALEYVHFPVAASPPRSPAGAEWFRPLGRLRRALPNGTRLVAGLADDGQSLGDQVRVLDLVEGAVGEAVDIAATCGLGTRTPEAARRLVGRMLELAVR